MVNLEKETVKKAGFATTLGMAVGMTIGSILSPQVESYIALKTELSEASATKRQYIVNQEMAEFKADEFYNKLRRIGKRIALDAYYPRRANFSRY